MTIWLCHGDIFGLSICCLGAGEDWKNCLSMEMQTKVEKVEKHTTDL